MRVYLRETFGLVHVNKLSGFFLRGFTDPSLLVIFLFVVSVVVIVIAVLVTVTVATAVAVLFGCEVQQAIAISEITSPADVAMPVESIPPLSGVLS